MVAKISSNSPKPLIGVTGNARRFSPSWWCIRLSIWLTGGKPIRISTKHEFEVEKLNGIVISGGDDIHPSLYSDKEEMPKAHYDEARDELEQRYIKHAFECDVPILGICRGYQLINVTAGGNLHLDIRELRDKTSNWGTVLPRKTLEIDANTLLHQITSKNRLKINSLHHQAVKQVANGYKAVAWDLDGFIQSIQHEEGLPVIGVQWHPEYLFYMSAHRNIFSWLVERAKEHRIS